MNRILGRGKIRYTRGSVIVDCDPQIQNYYFSLLPKYLNYTRQKYPSHISVMRGKYEVPLQESWGRFHGFTIEYEYEPVIRFGEIYCWLNVFSRQLEYVRESLNLYIDDRFTKPPTPFKKTFHLTIGNKKEKHSDDN